NLPDDAGVDRGQQEIWMESALKERQYAEVQPPWKDGIAARTSAFAVTLSEFLAYLRRNLPDEMLREDCYQVLLARRMRGRLPDAAPEKVERYVQEELARRRAEVEKNPKYKGIPWDRLLAAQGVLPEAMGQDPDVVAAALSRLWVERNYPDETLR